MLDVADSSIARAYRPEAPERSPLAGYLALIGAFTALLGATTALATRRRSAWRGWSLADLALAGVATHELSNIATRDWVTSPLRAPFTRFVKSEGNGELREEARGRGLQRAVGDLATCPYCSAPWVATAIVAGLATIPRATRVVCGVFAISAVSDFLHRAYARAKRE